MKPDKFLIVFFAILAMLFTGSLAASALGWGYMGYGGKHVRPSTWYDNNAKTYQDREVNEGSAGGVAHRGGGVRGGK